MYSVTQQDKVASQGKQPLQKHFYAASQTSSNSLLHFSYRLIDLQKEIEKRTFYLGKYRKTEEAAHLMDLIGMSRDEGDLLYPFAKAAMGDVYDQLNVSALHIPKEYEWKDAVQPITIIPLPALSTYSDSFSTTVSNNLKKLIVSGTITGLTLKGGGNIDNAKYGIAIKATVGYRTKYTIVDSNVIVTPTKVIEVEIPSEYIHKTPSGDWQVSQFTIDVPLEPQTNMSSAELIDDTFTGTVTVNDVQLLLKAPLKLNVGSVIEVNGISYDVLQDTDENNLDLKTQCKAVDVDETMVEGIHYYFSVPNFLNMSSVSPLDTAIMEALVNRIIWKWLVLSYPAEAATYDTLYQDNLKSIAMRCNIFNKHWQQVPRIL